MGVVIDKLPHSCGTTRGLNVFADEETGKVNGWCFSCNKFIANPYGTEKTIEDVDLPEPKSPEQIESELQEVHSLPTADVRQRKLRAEYLERFGIKTSYSEEDGKTLDKMYFPMYVKGKLSGYYVKTLTEPKFTWSLGEVKGAEPFGWQRAKRTGAYRLIITEGMEDAVAVESIMDRHGDEKYMPAVISLPNGAGSVDKSLSQIARDAETLFKEIVLCFDDDDAGRRAVSKAMQYFPHALSVTLPEKDANDCLIRGSQKAAYKALSYKATTPKNSRIVAADEALHASAREPTPYGQLTWPYEKLNQLLRGVRYGETIYLGAGVKMGKSEILNDIAAHFVKEHGIKVFMAKPEEQNSKTYKLMCNKIAGRVFHDPDVPFDYEAYDEAGKVLQGNLFMVDLYQEMSWDHLRADIVSAAGMGCKAIFIDPITNLTNGMNSADANTKLQEIAQGLSSLAADLQVVIFIFCHLKAPEGSMTKDAREKKYGKGEYIRLGNCPHEFGGSVQSTQFAGSRAMMRSCNLMIGIEGNKDPELPEDVRNIRCLTILEDREFGNSDSVQIYWNRNTTLFREV
jgi:twinkle protein